MTSQVTILTGAQWGDEGKGKWVDILAKSHDLVARFQGGNNAGHTLFINGVKTVLHQIPSGIFYDRICALTAGVVVNPTELLDEMQEVSARVQLSPNTLWLSARAHVITPWTVHLDGLSESTRSSAIGTTKRGIGPTYSEKANRSGLRLGDFVRSIERLRWFEERKSSDPSFAAHTEEHHDKWERFHAAAAQLEPFVNDADHKLRLCLRQGKRLLLEGAQGAMLDIDHGTYPYVTSSSTAAGGALASLGFQPRYIDKIYGVAKAYTTRVGAGPFPTQLDDATGEKLRALGKEFGATTGRPRRCGWLDAVALRYAVAVNGFDGVVLNKMDILSEFSEIKVCYAYDHPRLGQLDVVPWNAADFALCTPLYKSFDGWNEPLPRGGKISDLPKAALAYIRAVEEMIGTQVAMVGTGVERTDALFL